MEFSLIHGKPEQTEAMKTGSDRHTELEKEVVQNIQYIFLYFISYSTYCKFATFLCNLLILHTYIKDFLKNFSLFKIFPT